MAKLLVLNGPGEGLKYRLKEKATLGRQSDNEVPLQDAKASRQNSQIIYREGEYYIEDLDSRNGTLVDGKLVKSQKLRGGEKIQIGDTILLFTDSSGSSVREKCIPTADEDLPLPELDEILLEPHILPSRKTIPPMETIQQSTQLELQKEGEPQKIEEKSRRVLEEIKPEAALSPIGESKADELSTKAISPLPRQSKKAYLYKEKKLPKEGMLSAKFSAYANQHPWGMAIFLVLAIVFLGFLARMVTLEFLR